MKKLALHWKILIGMVLGIVFGFIMLQIDGGKGFVADCLVRESFALCSLASL